MFLDEILKIKTEEIASVRAAGDYEEAFEGLKEKIRAADPPRGFMEALGGGEGNGIRIVAEVKKASPSKGVIREEFDPVEIARSYEENGAAAISVLTEEKFFLGSLEDLARVRRSVSIPVLRKDFIIDPYHLYESRAAGADSVLLIAGILAGPLLEELISLSRALQMEALVEVHTEEDIKAAVDAGARAIGINNRDLKTFATDINTTTRLAGKVPPGTITVSESGINSADDVRRLKGSGVDAFLIGEALVRERDIGAKLREFQGRPSPPAAGEVKEANADEG